MKIIFQVDGGIGKSVAATAVCKAINAQYPDDELIVITGYPDVFLCNPGMKVYNFDDMRYFYEQYIEGKDYRIMAHNPYLETAFIKGNTHLIKVWCEMFGINYNGQQPKLHLTDREFNFYSAEFYSQKPLMVIQTSGGPKNQTVKYSWPRDLPLATAQKVVNAFAQDYTVVHLRREDQLPLQNVVTLKSNIGFRGIAVLITMSQKRLFIDSVGQHAAAALGKPSVVCMIDDTVATRFGYDMHHNIIANPPTIKPELRYSVYSKYNISGNPTEFPYHNEAEIYNAEQIIEALRNENYEGKSAEVKNLYIKEKIEQEAKPHYVANSSAGHASLSSGEGRGEVKCSMVANRLKHLTGKADLSNIKQVLDIGSWHLGQSIEFSNVFKDAKIDAFEPVPDSYNLCISNHNQLDEQKRNRINIHNIALSNEPGEVPFYSVEKGAAQNIDEGFSSMFRFNGELKVAGNGNGSVQKEITVKAETLDNWCKANKITEVDIMWVDAQGSELLVFQGAKKILKNTKIIMTEVGLKPYYEGHTLKPDIDKYLTTLGFRELAGSFELNGFDYEANTIYIRSDN